MAGGTVLIKWYATGFRGDALEVALGQIGAYSLRYGATRYDVLRSRDDRYNFMMTTEWESKEDWDAYWYGPEFTEMRAACSGWYQVPLLYVWNDKTASGEFKLRSDDDSDRAVAGDQVAAGGEGSV